MAPPLHGILDAAYRSVFDHTPLWVQERGMTNAFLIGGGVAYGAVRAAQLASRTLVDRVIPDFDETWLPKLEKGSIALITAAPIAYALIDPETAQNIVQNHPAYTSGLAGSYLGAVAGALQDLHRRSIEDAVSDPESS